MPVSCSCLLCWAVCRACGLSSHASVVCSHSFAAASTSVMSSSELEENTVRKKSEEEDRLALEKWKCLEKIMEENEYRPGEGDLVSGGPEHECENSCGDECVAKKICEKVVPNNENPREGCNQ